MTDNQPTGKSRSPVADTDRYENPQTDEPAGLEEPLTFKCGVHGEFTVNGWVFGPTAR